MDEKRKRIESLDRLIIRILKERINVGKELAKVKEDRDLKIEDPAQEKQVIRRAKEYAENQISKECGEKVEDIWKSIIALTKSEMQNESNSL